MEESTEKLKSFFRANHVEIFGIAPASLLEREPAGYRPSDLLLGANSAICLGLPIPRGIFKARGRDLRLYWRTANIYYRQIDAILLQAARLLEEKGETAVPVFG
jgi:epoxyqueuosine reductase QueG